MEDLREWESRAWLDLRVPRRMAIRAATRAVIPASSQIASDL